MGASMPRHIRLRDGRVLAWSELGDPAGVPVVSCHGGLVGRRDVEPADVAARDLYVRLLSPDRPGVGDSCREPGRHLLDWGNDLRELIEQLGIERFGVLGWSMGGAYALAAACALPDRVRRVALVAGCVPLDTPTRLAELNAMDRRLLRIARHAPWTMRAIAGAVRGVARRPGLLSRVLRRQHGRSDAALLAGQPPAWLAAAVRAGFADPEGVVDEYRVLGEPWGFGLEDVRVPVDIWQGDDDVYVPVDWARELARSLPDATLHLYPGEGHFLALLHYRRILGRLRS